MDYCAHDLSLDQLCGQLLVVGYPSDQVPSSLFDDISIGRRAGVILFKRNLPTLARAYDACQRLIGAAPQDTPVLVSIDEEGGRVRRLPPPFIQLPAMMRLASLDDTSLLQRAGEVVGAGLRALGIQLNFAPVLDIHTRPENPVIGDRAFGTTAQDVSRGALCYWRGLRSAGVLGCGKHFPGHGDTSIDSHIALPSVATAIERLKQVELVPFCDAIRSGMQCLMSAHIVCESMDASAPATLSYRVSTGLLREELGFEGVLFSDDLEMGAIGQRATIGQAAVQAVRAGCDVLLVCALEQRQNDVHAALVQEAQRDSGFRTRCEQAAERSISLRRGHRPDPAPSWEQALARVDSDQSRELQSELARAIR